MTDNTELKRLAAAIESCTSIPEKDEAAWMRRTTGRAVVDLLDELENFKAEVPKWTEREIKLIADNCQLEEKIEVLQADLKRMTEGRDGLRLALDEANKIITRQRDEGVKP